MPIGILLADDHPIFRQGLKSLLEKDGFNVLGEASNGMEAIEVAEQLRPDVVVLDFSMPLLNGMDAAREIRRVSNRSRLIMLTSHREGIYVTEALNAGISGYVLKSEASAALGEAIREVTKGNGYLSPSVTRFAVDSFLQKCAATPADDLSDRELEVLRLVAIGNTSKRIAEHLQLTVKMAEFLRSSLMLKLDIHDTAGLVRYAVRRGLVDPMAPNRA